VQTLLKGCHHLIMLELYGIVDCIQASAQVHHTILKYSLQVSMSGFLRTIRYDKYTRSNECRIHKFVGF